MSDDFKCWKCGMALQDVILPMSRREECAKCGADQHVCKMCAFYSRGRCDEDRAESVSDDERANFCDYFKPAGDAYRAADLEKAREAKRQLAALFGDPEPDFSDD